MTPRDEARTGATAGDFLQFGLAFVGGLVVAAGLAVLATGPKLAAAKAGWNLVPVVVAAQDITAGSTLEMEMISQRAIPEQFASPSTLRPERAGEAIGQRVAVDVQAGDPLRLDYFGRGPGGDACVAEVERLARSLKCPDDPGVRELVKRLGAK